MDNLFEAEVKDRLNWTFQQWEAEGLNSGSLKRLVNSLRFWYNKLSNAMRENNVIITLHEEIKKKAYPSLESFVEKLHSINSNIIITGYAKFRNRRFLSISFNDIVSRDFVVKNLREIDSAKIAYLHWVKETLQNVITVNWLSNHTDLDYVVDFMDQYMDIKSVVRETSVLKDGTECTSGKVVFKGQILKNIEIDNIPHIASIDGLECSIIVQGRSYKCYTCSKVGHRASECFLIFCNVCKATHSRNHNCVQFRQTLLQNKCPEQSNSLVQEEQAPVSEDILYNTSVKMKVDETMRNSFQEMRLIFPQEARKEMDLVNGAQWPFDITNRKDDLQTITPGKNEMKDTVSGFISTFSNEQYADVRKKNNFIREESYLGEPNFVLVDTSTDESDSDSSSNNNFMDKANWCLTDMENCARVSRSMVNDSLAFLNPVVSTKRPAQEESMNLKMAKQFSLDTDISTLDIEGGDERELLNKQNVLYGRESNSSHKKKRKKKRGHKK